MTIRVEVSPKGKVAGPRARRLIEAARALGVTALEHVTVTTLTLLRGDLSDADAERLVRSILCDGVVEDAVWWRTATGGPPSRAPGVWAVEVALRPGVTDSAAESLLEGARTAGIAGIEAAATAQRYLLEGELDDATIERIAGSLLANPVIQTWCVNHPIEPPFVLAAPARGGVARIPMSGATDPELLALSESRRLSLDLAEMRAIAAWFAAERREPTNVELEMLAQTWSEHCVHKTFRARIDYVEADPSGVELEETRTVVDGLLKETIRAATEKAAKPWIRSAFVDNAGIVAFDEAFDLSFKVETHNHPSALEPFGGAATGVGGVVRDVIGTSARPIANTDVLCFGPPDLPFEELPGGVLHPRRVAGGVISGVEDYGNKMGIPTVNGAILYDRGYVSNPLVFVGCLGLLPHGSHPTDPRRGDRVVCIGGRTGRDGLRGATFSSMEMSHETSAVAGSAVQVGHPIHEKQALEAVITARDERLYNAITDCGAGGLSSAVGEMAQSLGAEIHLDRVPLKYQGLEPWEIWLSEAQERMVLAVPPESWPRVEEICDGLDIDATDLGVFTGDGVITLRMHGEVVGRLSASFLHDGIPRRTLRAVYARPELREPELASPTDLAPPLLALLSSHGIRSKEDVVRQYDHEVQGGTVVKPLVGVKGDGPSDAAVLVPLEALRKSAEGRPRRGVALSVGINPRYGEIDPYAMAWAAVDEAVRNAVAVGADPDQLSLLDNFCWGNPSKPDRLGSLVRCAKGCHDAAVAFGAPYISGKDSLNNEYTGKDGDKHAIPGTILISALAIVPDVARTATSDLKEPFDLLYVVGLTDDELGGSAYYALSGEVGANVPLPLDIAPVLARTMHRAIAGGLVRACHDCSEGGLAVAVAEMAIGGRLGVELDLRNVVCGGELHRDDVVAFSESLTRFVVEVAPENAEAFELLFRELPASCIGEVRPDERVVFTGLSGGAALDIGVGELLGAFTG